MAWGVWNKIKQGFKKAGSIAKKVADVVTDNVIKPFRPIISGALSAYKPQAGAIADGVMGAVERFSDDGFTPFKKLRR
jgi:hypothetical protein